jgi:diaminopimelate epimerase
MDPTGNITALVESGVEIRRQPEAAGELMRLHPEVEQVEFVCFNEEPGADIQGELRMAGGEFCGNASMSAAALFALHKEGCFGDRVRAAGTDLMKVLLRVSGAADPVAIKLRRDAEGFTGEVKMPPALRIEEYTFEQEGTLGVLPLVRMEGISHIVIRPDSALAALALQKERAEEAVRKWCAELETDGLGLMFLDLEAGAADDPADAMPRLTPLVYIPGSGTSFWENSCASGSAATGMYLADRTGERQEICLREPGGCLKVTSDPGSGETLLYGTVRW